MTNHHEHIDVQTTETKIQRFIRMNPSKDMKTKKKLERCNAWTEEQLLAIIK